MDKRVCVKYYLFLSEFNQTSIFLGSFFKKYSNTKFYENMSGADVQRVRHGESQ
jgi:hypothetical protein